MPLPQHRILSDTLNPALTNKIIYVNSIVGSRIPWSDEFKRRVRVFAAERSLSKSIFQADIKDFLIAQGLTGHGQKIDDCLMKRVQAQFRTQMDVLSGYNIVKSANDGARKGCWSASWSDSIGSAWNGTLPRDPTFQHPNPTRMPTTTIDSYNPPDMTPTYSNMDNSTLDWVHDTLGHLKQLWDLRESSKQDLFDSGMEFSHSTKAREARILQKYINLLSGLGQLNKCTSHNSLTGLKEE